MYLGFPFWNPATGDTFQRTLAGPQSGCLFKKAHATSGDSPLGSSSGPAMPNPSEYVRSTRLRPTTRFMSSKGIATGDVIAKFDIIGEAISVCRRCAIGSRSRTGANVPIVQG